MKAPDHLREAADTIEARGREYDKSGGERSMDKTIRLFNIITGLDLKEKHGWLLMQLLKSVRLYTNPNYFHRDSVVDRTAYSALEAEAWHREESRELLKGVRPQP